MMNSKTTKSGILLLIMIMGLLPMIASADFVAKQMDAYELISGCTMDGLVCNSNTVECNVSLRDVDGGARQDQYVVYQSPMTVQTNGNANYTFNRTSMGTIGNMPGFVSCSNGVENSTEYFTLLVTPSGEDNNNLAYLTIFIGIGAFILLGFAKAENNAIIGFVAGIFFLLAGMSIFINGLFNYQNFYTQGVGGVYLVFFAWCGISAGIEWMEEMKIKYS